MAIFDDQEQPVLYEANFAYHVTNVEVTNEIHPNFNRLRGDLANDLFYDGDLVGLRCVFFTTTLRKVKLPEYSCYPTQGTPIQKYWRLKVPMRYFDRYKTIWWKNDGKSGQEHLILTRGDQSRLVENIPNITILRREYNRYLCIIYGKWYTNDYDYQDEGNRYFVNFAILEDFELELCNGCPEGCIEHCQWDKVRQGKRGAGNLISREELLAYNSHQTPLH